MKLCDLIVVGAGPAGVAAAIKSAEAGYSTIIVEKSEGRRKPCGGVLTTACIDVLSRELNLSLPENVLSSPSSLS
ncbi:MAG: FAD-dependent oxidoreductase, partial [Candidatus Jordarchaeales archaeon]